MTSVENDIAKSHSIEVDRRRHCVTVAGSPLALTPSEFYLLDTLLRQPGRVFSRGKLIDAAFGAEKIVLERIVDVHIHSLRAKLGEHATVIETVRGIGYRFRETHDQGQEQS